MSLRTKKTLVVGLSIQDNNLQTIFSRAKQVHPWPWPCAPQAPGHIFCEDVIKEGQIDVLKVVYGDAYNDNVDAIHASTHLQAWGEQVLLAFVLKLIADKLKKLMELALNEAGKAPMTTDLAALLAGLRDYIADLAVGDRTAFTYAAIVSWSRLLSLFRRGALPANAEVYEVVSNSVPENLETDQNARTNGLGRLGVALALLQHGRAAGLWELAPAKAPEATAGALTARGNWRGAPERPLFLVKSATEAIALKRQGAFANNKAIVVHADDAWLRIAGGSKSTGVRRPRGAPGRTGRVQTTHVSLGSLIEACDNAGRAQGSVCSGDGAMSDSPLVNVIVARLREAGYRDLSAPFRVATVEFEFTAALRGNDRRALDLVLVVDTTTGEFGDRDSARVRQRVEALGRALDVTGSRYVVTAILAGAALGGDIEALTETCRVLHVDGLRLDSNGELEGDAARNRLEDSSESCCR